MKFLCLAYYDAKKFNALPKAELEAIVSKCPAYDAALKKTGKLLLSASLSETQFTTIRPREGRPTITDGPFAEAKEMVGGFFIIEAADMQEAQSIAANHPAAHLGQHVGWGIEIRPIEYFEQPKESP